MTPLLLTVCLCCQVPEQPTPIKLTLTAPSAAPVHLLPPSRDLVPGNAAVLHQRNLAFFVENKFLLDEMNQEYWSRWLERSPGDWPVQEAGAKVGMLRYFVREAEVAASYRDCDWQLRDRPEGFGLLLPDVQGMRKLGIMCAAQARQQAATGDFAGAEKSLRAGLALGRNQGRNASCLIQVLVGAAITKLTLDASMELLNGPGAPDPYWALTELPRPFFEVAPVAREDLRFLENMLKEMRIDERTAMPAARVKDVEARFTALLDSYQMRKPTALESARNMLERVNLAGEARAALRKQGLDPEAVEAMPPFQASVVYALREHRAAADNLSRWFAVSDQFNHPAYKVAAHRYDESIKLWDRLAFRGLLRGLGDHSIATTTGRCYAAALRTDRKIATLRTIAAVRRYAATHDGAFPARLADITDVPVPTDPQTGQPFPYEMKGAVAVLRVSDTRDSPRSGEVYELTWKR